MTKLLEILEAGFYLFAGMTIGIFIGAFWQDRQRIQRAWKRRRVYARPGLGVKLLSPKEPPPPGSFIIYEYTQPGGAPAGPRDAKDQLALERIKAGENIDLVIQSLYVPGFTDTAKDFVKQEKRIIRDRLKRYLRQ